MKNVLTCISYTFSAMEMVGLLWWNTGNDIHFAEFHTAKRLRMYTELCGRKVPSHKLMQNMNNDSMEMMMIWQHCRETQVQVYAEFPGLLA
jgi:hypothetical protein